MLRLAALLAAPVMLVTLGGCRAIVLAPRPPGPVVVGEPGPPPHAPARGYRRHHPSGPELRFDQSLGVYVVVGYTDVYFHDGWYLRFHSGAWQVSAALDGPWERKSAESLPPGLRSKHHGKKGKHRGHDEAPARGDW